MRDRLKVLEKEFVRKELQNKWVQLNAILMDKLYREPIDVSASVKIAVDSIIV